MLYLLENKKITIDEIEKYMFSPYFVKKLQLLQIDEEIISIIEHCCELEDIESLITQELGGIIGEIKNEALSLLEKIPDIDLYTVKKWID